MAPGFQLQPESSLGGPGFVQDASTAATELCGVYVDTKANHQMLIFADF